VKTMSSLQWKRFVGQERIKEVFASAFAHGTLGHAYLLCGEAGVGTFAAALELSMALLCGSDTARPCGVCGSCKKVLTYAHPDFHVVMPIVLQKEHKGSDGKITEAGWTEFAERVRERIGDPYLIQEFPSIPSIPVDWIREVTHAIMRGALERGKNIVVIDGVDSMQQEAANAMLKTLEEPPADTLLLLCTARPHAVLPTIVSRCQILRFAALPPDIVRRELCARLNVGADDPRLAKVIYAGSIGRGRRLFEQLSDCDSAEAPGFWSSIVKRDWLQLFGLIDRMGSAADYGRCENLFVQVMYGVRNSFYTNIDGTEKYILGEGFFEGALPRGITPREVEQVAMLCEKAISGIRARANAPLVLLDFALSVMELYDGQKQ